MLSERYYMGSQSGRNYWAGKNSVFILIIITVVIFIVVPVGSKVWLDLALRSYGIRQFKIWQFLTYMFLHANFAHILFNMWGVYLFGSVILPILGTTRFLILYFLSGVSGAGLWLLINWNSRVPIVGASAGVFGVMMAAAMLHPNLKIQLLFPPIPMKMKTFVTIYAAIELVNEISHLQGGVAHLAHLGGVISAYFYIKSVYGNQVWDMFGFLGRGKRKTSSKLPKDWKVYTNSSGGNVSKEEVNRILDKITAHGMQSLTDEEMNVLRKASDEMKNRKT